MRLGHIGLTCADLDRSERFYRDLFGFETFFRIRRKTPWLAAQVGYQDADIEFCHMRGCNGLHLELLKYWSPSSSETLFDETFVPGNVHFNIWVEDAQAMAHSVAIWLAKNPDLRGKARFAPKDLDIEASTITDGPQKGGKGYYMRDPDGHTIEAWEPAPGAVFDTGKSLPAELANIIDKLEAARARQNTNWMGIVRLVYRVAPQEAKDLFRKIEAQDSEILKIAQSSANVV